jgi:hypothetical protein
MVTGENADSLYAHYFNIVYSIKKQNRDIHGTYL